MIARERSFAVKRIPLETIDAAVRAAGPGAGIGQL